jgi:hypothetical protein
MIARALGVQAGLGRQQLEQRVAVIGDVRPSDCVCLKMDVRGDVPISHHELAAALVASRAQRA